MVICMFSPGFVESHVAEIRLVESHFAELLFVESQYTEISFRRILILWSNYNYQKYLPYDNSTNWDFCKIIFSTFWYTAKKNRPAY